MGWALAVEPDTLAAVAKATLDAAAAGIERAKDDEGLGYCVHLLVTVARAGRSEDFLDLLSEAGIVDPLLGGLPDVRMSVATAEATKQLTVWELVCGVSDAADRYLRGTRARSDIADMAQLAACECLDASCGAASRSLFDGAGGGGDNGEWGDKAMASLRPALRAISTETGFAALMHDFIARFTGRFLQYHLSRELSNHVGEGRRFATIEEHNGFLEGLDRHCRMSARIIEKFAGVWYSKHDWKKDHSLAQAKGFASHALEKVRMALEYQEGRDVRR
jgi:hypothetical protein